MKKKLTALIAFLVTGLVLVGCSVTVEPATPPPIQVTATDDVAPEPLATVSQNRTIEVTVPGSLDGDLVVFEAEGPGTKRIVVRDADGNIIGGSSSPYYFVPESGFSYLSDFSAEFNTESIGVTSKCVGPCVIVESSNSTKKYTVEVRTNGQSDFFAYASDYGDETEPMNTNPSIAPTILAGETLRGAFETLDDVDYYFPDSSFDVKIVADGEGFGHELILIVEVKHGNDPFEVVPPTEVMSGFEVMYGSVVRVSTVDGFAGSYHASKYSLITGEF